MHVHAQAVYSPASPPHMGGLVGVYHSSGCKKVLCFSVLVCMCTTLCDFVFVHPRVLFMLSGRVRHFLMYVFSGAFMQI